MIAAAAQLRAAMARNAFGTEGCCQHGPRTPLRCNLFGSAAVSIAMQPFRQSARSPRPRNIADAHFINDWLILREARHVPELTAFSYPLAMTRIRASAALRACLLPRHVLSNSACSHLTLRVSKIAASSMQEAQM